MKVAPLLVVLLTLAVLSPACSAAAVSDTTTTTTTLRRVFLLHRHGAREALGIVNGTTLACRPPFCELTDEGREMMLSLGRHLALAYKANLGIEDAYNVSFISSNATEYARVAVSAEAVIMGMFEGGSPLPFVDFAPKEEDTELVMWESWPTWRLRATYAAELHADDAWVRGFIGSDNLTKIGAFAHAGQLCAQAPTDCVAFIQDVLAANASAGHPSPQWLLELWPKLKVVVARFLGRILGFHPQSSTYSRSVGSYGFPLAQRAMEFFARRTAANTTADLWRMFHVGAHDWTVFALLTALGAWTPATQDAPEWVVPFGEVVLLELHEHVREPFNGGGGGGLVVKVLRGSTDQQPGSHPYTFSPLEVECIAANGTSYRATTCPLDDLWRRVNSTAPESSDGVCFATDDMLSDASCDGDAAPAAGSRCLFFRARCPDQPCGQVPGAVADPARGFACQSAQLGKGTPFVVATMVALMAPSLLAGAIGGFYGAGRIRRLLWRRGPTSSEEEQPIAK